MRLEKQFSVFMVNKPGVLANVLGEIADSKVNVVALTMMDSMEHGVLRVVSTNADKTRAVLTKLNMPFSETDVLCLTISNKPGALAEVAEKLAKNHINITYAYCTAGAWGGKATGIVKVADVSKAMKILAPNGIPAGKSRPVVRRSPSTRR
ncbi:MAG TPA: ACT domain-containing protein [Sedimentisphaerales bacterium]|nr:ACT domain-containing protein [Sedimentisphaerales bacterium]